MRLVTRKTNHVTRERKPSAQRSDLSGADRNWRRSSVANGPGAIQSCSHDESSIKTPWWHVLRNSLVGKTNWSAGRVRHPERAWNSCSSPPSLSRSVPLCYLALPQVLHNKRVLISRAFFLRSVSHYSNSSNLRGHWGNFWICSRLGQRRGFAWAPRLQLAAEVGHSWIEP